jgi:hypothetical protein
MSDDGLYKSPTQGGIANKQGKVLEATVISIFEQHGFLKAPYAAWKKDKKKYGDEVLICGAPYTSIYGHNGKTEFLALSQRLSRSIRIECKWQQSAGSVDEKFPYLYLNCVQAMPENEIVIIVDGGGAKESAINWLRQAARDRLFLQDLPEKRIHVFTVSEFMIWGNTALR